MFGIQRHESSSVACRSLVCILRAILHIPPSSPSLLLPSLNSQIILTTERNEATYCHWFTETGRATEIDRECVLSDWAWVRQSARFRSSFAAFLFYFLLLISNDICSIIYNVKRENFMLIYFICAIYGLEAARLSEANERAGAIAI